MALTRPSMVSPIKPFTPYDSYDFPFLYSSGAQATKNNLVIQRLSDNKEIYNQTIESFSLKHPIPSNTLPSGVSYRVRVRVGSVNNEWSQFSDWVIFWVLDEPDITVTNIDYENQNRVYNQTVTFSATYDHPNSELLQSYKYNLYNSNKTLIQSYSEIYANGELPLTQEVTGLANGDLYYIELKTITVNLQEFSTGLILVRPFYIAPKFSSVIKTENLASEGAIKLSANIIQIIGKLYDNEGNEISRDEIEYVENEKLDLNRADYARLVFSDGFDIATGEFVLKLWCENIPETTNFLQLRSGQGHINLIKYNNKIHAFKYLNRVKYPAHFASNSFDVEDDQQFMIFMRSMDESIDISVDIIE